VAKGTRPGSVARPSKTGSRGRVCAYPGCDTHLSVYNRSDRCWQHADIVFPNLRGKRLDRGPS
jgi:hypothetical protein